MTLKIQEIELELPEGANVEIAEDGKKISVKGFDQQAEAREVHHHHYPGLQVWTWWNPPNWTYTIPDPYCVNPLPLGTPIVGSGGTAMPFGSAQTVSTGFTTAPITFGSFC